MAIELFELRSVWHVQGQDAQFAKGQPPQPGAQECKLASGVQKQGEGGDHVDALDPVTAQSYKVTTCCYKPLLSSLTMLLQLRIRNIPNRYTQRELIQELEDLGFAGTFDFLYSPLDKGTMSNVGYAFVNFKSHEHASKCIDAFHNYRFKRGLVKPFGEFSIWHRRGEREVSI